MHPSFFPKTHLTKFLIVLLLLVALTSCGTQNQPNATSTSTPTSSSSSSLTSNQSDNLSLNKTGVAIDQGGLHIEASDGVQCPSGKWTTGQPDHPDSPQFGAPLPGNNLVLATDHLTYDSNEIQQMTDYLKSMENGTNPNQMPVPNTFRWVLGGPTGLARSFNISGFQYMFDCGIDYNITNTGSDVLQIASVGVQLTASPRMNTYHYRLIDECSILGNDCPEFGGSPGTCGVYYATIKLDANSGNSVFSAPPVGYDTSCSELTLNPRDSKDLVVYIYSPQNSIYSAVPQLTLDTSSGPNTLTLTDLSSTLAFANDSQFICYGLQGDTFVVESTSAENVRCI